MNSTMQQLFMIPTFSKALIELDDPEFKENEIEANLLFQLKVNFSNNQDLFYY